MLIPLGYSQVNLIFTGVPVPTGAQVTFGVDNQTDDLSPSAIAAIVSAHYVTNLKSYLDSNASLATIRVKNGPNDTGPAVDAAGPGAGSASNSSVAPNTATLIRKVTAFGGRSGSGRMYHPCVDEAWIDEGGNLGGGTLTALQGAWDDFLADLDASNVPMVLLHNTTDVFASPTRVLGLEVQTKVATQRRRLRR